MAAVIALVVVLIVNSSGSSGETPVAAPSSSSSSSATATEETAPTRESTDYQSLTEVRSAMLRYLDARNARDVAAMRAAVCSQSRAKITGPPTGEGDIVLDRFVETVFDGNVAESEVVSYLTLGDRRSGLQRSKERFLKEDGTWYYCPGAEPDIGT